MGAVAVSGGLAGVTAYKQLTNVGKDIAKLGQTPSAGKLLGALGSVSISLGTQKSESNSRSNESTSQGSSVTAGNGKVNLTATGAGTANDSKTTPESGSDILIQGSHVAGQTGTYLTADDDIIIKAGESTHAAQSSNKSSGGSIGVSLSANGLTANIGINAAKGKTNGSGTTYTAATVGDAGSATTFTSGDDTTLVGAQLIGQTVTGTVGGDLGITSTQDTSRYTAKQTNASVGVSIPIGAGAFGVSGSFSNENTKANTQTVKEVSGVFAGSGGYNLNVTGQTSLTGATIASTAHPALNSLTTGSLSTQDLHNSSDYKANSMGLSASWSGKETENVIGADGKPTGATQPKMVTNPNTGVTSQAQSGYNGYNAGLPSVMTAKGSTDSTTHAGISAGTVTITNEAAQHAATGQTGAQTIAGLNRNVSADPLNNTGVANLYEQDKDKIATGFAIVKTLGQNTNTFMAEMAKDLDKKGAQPAIGEDGKAIMVDVKDSNGNITQQPATIAQAVAAGFKPVGDTASGYISQNKAFGSGGYGSILLTGIVGAASGNVTGSGSALLQNTAINVLRQYGAQQIKGIADGFRPAGASTDDALSGSVRAALHAIAGCAGAAATGGDCTSAAAGSAATVALNNLIGADTTKMTAEQKQAYSNLMGTLVAGVTAGVGGDAAAAQLAAQVEVENNALSDDLFEGDYASCLQAGGSEQHCNGEGLQKLTPKQVLAARALGFTLAAGAVVSPELATACLTNTACRTAATSLGIITDLQNAADGVPRAGGVASGIQLPSNPSQLAHIFRDGAGHLTNTAANREIISNLVNNVKNAQGADKYGNIVYSITSPDGSQLWAYVRNGVVQNAGMNIPPRTYIPNVGLK